MADSSLEPTFKLKLFVSGSTPRSTRAIENLHRICEEHLKGQYEVEMIDVYQNPEMAADFQIVATPTLLKLLPAPLRRVVGDLSDENKVLAGLGLKAKAA